MKKYMNPEITMITVEAEDILTLSFGENGVANDLGYDALFPEV